MELDKEKNTGYLTNIAREDFEVALRKGFWGSIKSWFNKSPNHLLPFDEIRRVLPIQGQYDIGVRQIELDKIIGSVGRYNDFDQSFLPRFRHIRSRWINIDLANLREISLPPIDVYKVGDVYFVKDGNHRVSVARERGQAFIDANVIEIKVDTPIDRTTNIDKFIMLQEKAFFYKTTQLKTFFPDAEIELTLPGQYEKLLEHINVHHWYMGEHAHQEVSYQDAVTGWYNEVYIPLIKVIEAQDILHKFPGRTTADLYLWVIEHLYYLREENNSDVSNEEAAAHFTEEFSKRPLQRFFLQSVRFLRKLLRGSAD